MSDKPKQKRYELKPGHELRGFVIRLYPTRDQEDWLIQQQTNLMIVWNWMIAQSKTHDRAVQSYAIRNGLVPARPVVPSYDGMEADVAHAAKEAHRTAVIAWYQDLKFATKSAECCKRRKFREWLDEYKVKHDYQFFNIVLKWSTGQWDEAGKLISCQKISPHMGQALAKNLFAKSARPKRSKQYPSEMPVQVRSGDCFDLGNFGYRGQNPAFYNCQVSIGGQKIRGRLPGKNPGGRVLQGVSLTKEADGWYGAIKVETPIRQSPSPVANSVIGLDVGLDNIVAMSDSRIVINPRDIKFNDKIAKLQQMADLTNDHNYAVELNSKANRIHQKLRRRLRHILFNDVIKYLQRTEIIKVEKLSSKIGQMGSRKISVMRLTYRLLKERYGDRVRAVECAYTSQDCSQCGKRDKESWSYGNGPFCTCKYCGYKEHRDINAARNIAAKSEISLDILG